MLCALKSSRRPVSEPLRSSDVPKSLPGLLILRILLVPG